jgi:hypothetical protein
MVQETSIRLVDVEKVQHWDSLGHFFAAAAEILKLRFCAGMSWTMQLAYSRFIAQPLAGIGLTLMPGSVPT